MRGARITALITLATLNIFTLAAGVAVARMLPPRLAALHIPVAAARPTVRAAAVLAPVQVPAVVGDGGKTGAAGASPALPTATGLSALVAATLPGGEVGPALGVEVADAQTGDVLYSGNSATLATPASTTKVVTAVAALAVLGPGARFSTSVRQVAGGIVLVGGGDPTLAVNGYPSSDYPRPATLAALAAHTARALAAEGRRSVRLGYDTSLYSGPGMAPGWSDADISTGNVTPIVALEADQGRLTASGALEDWDDPVNFSPRTTDPAGLTASAFAGLLQRDGITVSGGPSPASAPASAPTLASVSSPPLSAIVEQMLRESNNVIAENLARHLAIAMGLPATFGGAAKAVQTELRQLGVTTPIGLVDGSGLSPDDGIAPETLVRVLEVAASSPRLGAAVTGLPVAGFTGTLSAGDSVFGGIGGAARGVVRAKTGNLATVATLAGLVYDRSGRLLIFAIMAPQVPGAAMLQTAAGAIDTAAAGLADCGCRLLPAALPPLQVSTYGRSVSSAQMIDWDLAISTGVRFARQGPQVSLADARAVVAELRGLTAVVQQPVREVTGLTSQVSAGPVAVVDRPGWIRANVGGFRVVLEPLAEKLSERSHAVPAAGSVLGSVGSRVTGVQAGLILAYLSARVLGQYELFLPPGEGTAVNGSSPNGSAQSGDTAPSVGRLTLVAPNIVMVERELRVDPHDFRRWVCLHEETHRVQFTSVPWLRGYVQGMMTEFLLASDLDPGAIVDRLRAAAGAVAGAVRGGDGESLVEAMQTPAQRALLDKLTAVMTLVEGHGDYVMDAVGPQVVPSVAEIREKFTQRRGSAGRVEQILRRILGIDLKMKQYAEGSKFVRTVVEEAGMPVFNKVWTSPETLPTRDELSRPADWLARVA